MSPSDVMIRAFLLSNIGANQSVLGPIPASMLYSGEHLRGSPYDVTVEPSAACAGRSVATIASLATVGVASTFVLEIRDSFSNFRTCELNQWISFFGMEPITGSYAIRGASCLFSFVPSNATVGFVNILVDNSFVLPEPSALVVLSGRLSLIRSTIAISSLTTAGVPISFSLSLFDSVNNTKDLKIFSSSIEILLNNSNYSRTKPITADVHPALAPISKLSSFQFVVTVSAHFFMSVLFMNASYAYLPLVVVPSFACATTSSMVGNAISLATNDAMSQFVLHLRDSFGNEALLDALTSAFVFASTAPRFCSASVMPLPSNSRIPVSFIFRHARISASSALPQMNAMLAFVGGLTATLVLTASFLRL